MAENNEMNEMNEMNELASKINELSIKDGTLLTKLKNFVEKLEDKVNEREKENCMKEYKKAKCELSQEIQHYIIAYISWMNEDNFIDIDKWALIVKDGIMLEYDLYQFKLDSLKDETIKRLRRMKPDPERCDHFFIKDSDVPYRMCLVCKAEIL